jgi:hypothetical protein
MQELRLLLQQGLVERFRPIDYFDVLDMRTLGKTPRLARQRPGLGAAPLTSCCSTKPALPSCLSSMIETPCYVRQEFQVSHGETSQRIGRRRSTTFRFGDPARYIYSEYRILEEHCLDQVFLQTTHLPYPCFVDNQPHQPIHQRRKHHR